MNLFKQNLIFKPDLSVDSLEVTPTFFTDLDKHYPDFHGHTLIAAGQFNQDWPSWEIHPAGDETVMLMSGSATMVLKIDGEDQIVELSEPGDCIVVPKNTWHTAKISEPTSLFFITPGEGTLNETVPPQEER